ncbi:hypothetical protein [Mycobacterium shigaense]|uniref:hypothetical protein n=1 Tax=Mycobacterium shigaense TaxID=722731 RepID=UPI002AE05329|nr:hypothetical protein [Mycobacterium shigaense]MEA1121719.1 hypothetical protein [Mycobacterium shigaense]
MTATIPLPAGYTKLHDWENGPGQRYFDGSTWLVQEPVPGANDYEDIGIRIWGRQWHGGVERCISIENSGVITVAQARELAEVLNAAADEAERMNEIDLSVTGETVMA